MVQFLITCKKLVALFDEEEAQGITDKGKKSKKKSLFGSKKVEKKSGKSYIKQEYTLSEDV